CPQDGEVVPRSEIIRGYEFEKGHYVTFSDEELKALDQKATQGNADEVRSLEDVPAPEREGKAAELKLARDLIARLASKRFEPGEYEDQVRKRIREWIARKQEGEDVTQAPEARPRAEVIDLMSALKASLARRDESAAAPRRESRGRKRTSARSRATSRQAALLRRAR